MCSEKHDTRAKGFRVDGGISLVPLGRVFGSFRLVDRRWRG